MFVHLQRRLGILGYDVDLLAVQIFKILKAHTLGCGIEFEVGWHVESRGVIPVEFHNKNISQS